MPVYQAVTVTDDLSGSRRQVLRAVGIGTTVALAGCSGSGGGDSSGETDSPTRTEPGTENTPNQTQTDSPNDEGEYPTQESQNLQKKLDELVERYDGSDPDEAELISLKADIDSLDIDKYPDITEKYGPDSKTDIMKGDGAAQGIYSLDKALYLASTVGTPDSDTNSIYFVVENPKFGEQTDDTVFMNINPNEVDASLSNHRYYAVGDPDRGEDELSQSEAIDSHQRFFEESDLTADEVVHAVDLEDTYIEEALQ
jgi:hypothetical protein